MGFETAKELDSYAKALANALKTADKILKDMVKQSAGWKKDLDKLNEDLVAAGDLGPKAKAEVGQQALELLWSLTGFVLAPETADHLSESMDELQKVASKLDRKAYDNYQKTLVKKYKATKAAELKKGDDIVIGHRRGKVAKIEEREQIRRYYDKGRSDVVVVRYVDKLATIEFEDGEKVTKDVESLKPLLGTIWKKV